MDETTKYTPSIDDPDGGDHLALLTVDVDPFTLDVTARENGKVVELADWQRERVIEEAERMGE